LQILATPKGDMYIFPKVTIVWSYDQSLKFYTLIFNYNDTRLTAVFFQGSLAKPAP